MSEWVIEAGDKDFETAVLERSKTLPVVVDFWAPWCDPCRTLGPLLERLAEEHNGAFVLAKVDVDRNPGLAQALQVQSVPMVLGFRDGAIVSEFVGALPEVAVRKFLTEVLPSAADQLAAEGDRLLRAGDRAAAEERFDAALEQDPRCVPALIGKARVLADRQETAPALALLERVGPGPLRGNADRLAAELRIQGGTTGDENGLRARIADHPADLEAHFELGQVLAAMRKFPEALDQYLEIVRRERTFQDGAARKAMIDIFDLLGAGDSIVEHYRSELAKVLFS